MASVLDAIRDAVGEVFTELESVTKLVGYQSAGNATYNTSTGAVTRPTTAFSVPAFVIDFKHREIDGLVVRVGDKRLLFEKSDAEARATAAGTTFGPKLNDSVLIDAVEHLVVSWETDPADATVSVQVRRSV